MNSPIIYQVIFGLLFLFFCYLTYMFTRTWRWPQVTVSFFLFVTAIAFCFNAARTTATHMAWKQAHRELTTGLNKERQMRDRLLHGDRKLTIQEDHSVRSLQAELGRTLLDRGRVWRDCTVTQANPTAVAVNTVPPGATAAPANGIAEGTVLYAFVDQEVTAEFTEPPLSLPAGTVGKKVPFYFVAEFTAAAVTDTSVTLQWTQPPRDYENRVINGYVLNNPNPPTWTLYETMPVDGHRYFAADLSEEPNLSEDADQEPVFGKMDEASIRRLFQSYKELVGDNWEAMIQPYLRDGRRPTDSDPPESRWLKIRFTQNHQEQVDSVAPLGGVTQSESFFSGDGLANVPLVRRGEQAEFKVDDWGVFRTQDATRLVNDGICEGREEVYVRDVVGYDLAIRSNLQLIASLELDQQRVARNTAAVTESNRRTLEQSAFRRTEAEQLNEDHAKINLELQKMTEYYSLLQQQATAKMAELSRLYQSNLQLEAELKRIERALTVLINRRSQEARGETGAQ